ncbi:uncharacterized protein LY79DRAFT_100727 [Colletotrichum navitas]|uniref:Uncharacterized protein n=1 Tax=Colletotrichum navitas TaxID=681940 RepID=A0AAD8V749_9PEZI|nr:uncharacterized protein LY79DRAFT_100727 [Colletotrichum navitas]KAK1595519.1 hypothetical protein LY79DRAFT_100727 [Colletotrichum navitas]
MTDDELMMWQPVRLASECRRLRCIGLKDWRSEAAICRGPITSPPPPHRAGQSTSCRSCPTLPRHWTEEFLTVDVPREKRCGEATAARQIGRSMRHARGQSWSVGLLQTASVYSIDRARISWVEVQVGNCSQCFRKTISNVESDCCLEVGLTSGTTLGRMSKTRHLLHAGEASIYLSSSSQAACP